jgi:hypothetical protein
MGRTNEILKGSFMAFICLLSEHIRRTQERFPKPAQACYLSAADNVFSV